MPRTTKHLEKFKFKKGEPTANPLGRKLENPEMKRLKTLSEEEMVEIGSLVVKGSLDELKAISKDPKASALKCMMASVAIKTISTGNAQALDILLNRLVGKVKEHVIVKSTNETSVNAQHSVISDDEYRKRRQKMLTDV